MLFPGTGKLSGLVKLIGKRDAAPHWCSHELPLELFFGSDNVITEVTKQILLDIKRWIFRQRRFSPCSAHVIHHVET